MSDALRDRLMAERNAAQTVTEVIAAQAGIEWYNTRTEPCRPDRIPTLVELAEWLPEADAGATTETVRRGNDAWSVLREHEMPSTNAAIRFNLLGFQVPMVAVVEAASWLQKREIGAGDPELLIGAFHLLWLDARQRNAALRHPIGPLVADWQEHAPYAVDVDRQPRAILPAALRDARREPANRLPLSLDKATPMGASTQAYLPGLEPPPSALVPVLPLALYDLAGGPMATRGRGAPVAQRLFFEVLLSVGRIDRSPGRTARLEVTYRDLVTWLWPNLRGRAWKRQRHLPALYRALLELDGMRVQWERQLWRLVAVQSLPTTATRPDDPVVFRVEHLPGSGQGPLIDRDALRRWGLVSAPAWRASLRIAYLWDEAKRRNNGARVYATRPVVARGYGGVLLGANGKPLRDRRNAAVKNWGDDRAVQLGANGKPAGEGNPVAYERNPAADRVPELGPDDLIRLCFDGNMDLTATARRKRLERAREALGDLETAGQIVREPNGHGGERIIEAWHP